MTTTPSRARRVMRASASLVTSPACDGPGLFPPCSAQRLPSIPHGSSPVSRVLVSGAAPRVANISVQAGDDAACWTLRHSPALAATLELPSGSASRAGQARQQGARCWFAASVPERMHCPRVAIPLTPSGMVPESGTEPRNTDDRSRDDLSGRRAVPLD
jgi:hypothetical protein